MQHYTVNDVTISYPCLIIGVDNMNCTETVCTYHHVIICSGIAEW